MARGNAPSFSSITIKNQTKNQSKKHVQVKHVQKLIGGLFF